MWQRQMPKGMLVTKGCASCTLDEAPAVGYLCVCERERDMEGWAGTLS